MSNWLRSLVRAGGVATIVLFGAVGSTGASAEYPDRPVKLIVPYAPGGSSDIVGRQIAEFLGRALGQPVVVENVGGGGGAVGTQRATGAAPDGYTLLIGANSELLINKLLQPSLAYDAQRDLTPIALIGTGAIVIIGKTALQATTLQDALALSKSRPDGLNYGTSGQGTIQHLAGEMVKLRTHANLTHVPYRGAGPVLTDVVGGHVDLGIATLASAKPYIDAGQAKAFAVTSSHRSEFAPQIPAITEVPGLAGVSLETWYGLFAPAKLPPAIAARLEERMNEVLRNPELKKNLANQAISISTKSAKDMVPFLAAENEKFRSVISEGKITIQ